MKFKISLDDFWLDEDQELEPALKAHIQRDVIQKITKQIEDKVQAQIADKVQEVIEQKITATIDNAISEFITTGIIHVKKGYNNDREEIPVQQHLKQVFEESSGWSNPNEIMKKFAAKFGNELKTRYDNVFASHIVKGLKEQGMLKQEVVELLLEGKPTQHKAGH